MRAEELFVSAAEIRVRYRFFNNATDDATTLVAFPMPEIEGGALSEGNVVIPTDDPENILGFSTVVDGQPVTTRVEQRVRAQGIDRTDMLRGLGIPLAPHLDGTAEALNQLSAPDRQQLLRLGIVEIEGEHLEPHWTLQTTYYWEQTFPARRELVIEHRYQPSVGTSVGRSAETAERKRQDLLSRLR
jgi:hypothetical protein